MKTIHIEGQITKLAWDKKKGWTFAFAANGDQDMPAEALTQLARSDVIMEIKPLQMSLIQEA